MRTAQEASAINRMLKSHGLPGLEDATGLLPRLGFLVQDHEHLRSLLVRCEAENRSAMYDSLKPYLKFQPKPLDVYIAESAERAEKQKLPTINAEGQLHWGSLTQEVRKAGNEDCPACGHIHPYDEACAVSEDIATAQAAVNAAFAKHHLTVTCRKCTKTETFSGARRADAVQAARDAGWVYDPIGEGYEICSDCP